MRGIKIVLSVACIFLAAALTSFSQSEDEMEIRNLIKKIDQIYRAEASTATLEMEIVTPHWSRTLKMETWTEGTKKTFIRILKPAKEEGTGTLRVGNEMWNYLPKTNKVIKIPPSMMMSSWMGSDFTNDDLVKEFTFFDDFTYEWYEPEDPREGVYYVSCIPKEDRPIIWGNVVVAARKDDYIPLWQKYYDEKGNLMRELKYSEVKTFDDRRIPSVMEMIPQNEEGHKTTIRYLEAEFNVDISEDIFSLRNLRAY